MLQHCDRATPFTSWVCGGTQGASVHLDNRRYRPPLLYITYGHKPTRNLQEKSVWRRSWVWWSWPFWVLVWQCLCHCIGLPRCIWFPTKGFIISTIIFISLFNAASIDGHALAKMESFASLEDLVSFDIITQSVQEVLMEKETNKGYGLGKGRERNTFLFDDLPSLDEQVSLEPTCTSIVVRGFRDLAL